MEVYDVSNSAYHAYATLVASMCVNRVKRSDVEEKAESEVRVIGIEETPKYTEIDYFTGKYLDLGI